MPLLDVLPDGDVVERGGGADIKFTLRGYDVFVPAQFVARFGYVLDDATVGREKIASGMYGTTFAACKSTATIFGRDCEFAIKFGFITDKEIELAREAGEKGFGVPVVEAIEAIPLYHAVSIEKFMFGPVKKGDRMKMKTITNAIPDDVSEDEYMHPGALVMERVDNSMFNALRHGKTKIGPRGLKSLVEMIKKYLRSGFWHRDLHPNNLLVSVRGDEIVEFYIADFGRSRRGQPLSRAWSDIMAPFGGPEDGFLFFLIKFGRHGQAFKTRDLWNTAKQLYKQLATANYAPRDERALVQEAAARM